jgi:hypothetical protein
MAESSHSGRFLSTRTQGRRREGRLGSISMPLVSVYSARLRGVSRGARRAGRPLAPPAGTRNDSLGRRDSCPWHALALLDLPLLRGLLCVQMPEGVQEVLEVSTAGNVHTRLRLLELPHLLPGVKSRELCRSSERRRLPLSREHQGDQEALFRSSASAAWVRVCGASPEVHRLAWDDIGMYPFPLLTNRRVGSTSFFEFNQPTAQPVRQVSPTVSQCLRETQPRLACKRQCW